MADEITVKIEGIQELVKNLKAYQFIKKEAIRIAIERGALRVELAAKEMCPVDTGHLRSKITTDKSELQQFLAKVGTNVEYAAYVEHGTKKSKAQPYLHPALFMLEGEIIKDIEKILDKDEKLK